MPCCVARCYTYKFMIKDKIWLQCYATTKINSPIGRTHKTFVLILHDAHIPLQRPGLRQGFEQKESRTPALRLFFCSKRRSFRTIMEFDHKCLVMLIGYAIRPVSSHYSAFPTAATPTAQVHGGSIKRAPTLSSPVT